MVTKIIMGWIQTASDYEYGPTPVIYIGTQSQPTRSARTECESLNDNDWEELELIPEEAYSKAYRVKITVELLEETELKPKLNWYGEEKE